MSRRAGVRRTLDTHRLLFVDEFVGHTPLWSDATRDLLGGMGLLQQRARNRGKDTTLIASMLWLG